MAKGGGKGPEGKCRRVRGKKIETMDGNSVGMSVPGYRGSTNPAKLLED